MSIWRDIWKSAVLANQKMVLEKDLNANVFVPLLEKYGEDGMIFYEMGEACETLKLEDSAIKNYKKAQELFPVPHWKKVAAFAINRIETNSTHFDSAGYKEFYKLQWNSFHIMHTFVNLLDECRYLGISALSRIDSEPNSEIVHFRTAMEVELEFRYPDLISSLGKNFCLKEALERLRVQGVDWKIMRDMDNIRGEGNLSAHKNDYNEKYLSRTIKSFIIVMEFFNNISV